MVKSLAIVWAQYGPYHFARVEGLRKVCAGTELHSIELSDHTRDYLWRRDEGNSRVKTLLPGAPSEDLDFWSVFCRTRATLSDFGVEVCLVPSYWPKQSLAVLLAAKSLGIRVVMMNETHSGTARATGIAAVAKRKLLGLFDSALVGGSPQKRYFASMGMQKLKIFTGYDAVDNSYFALRSEAHRNEAFELRRSYELPESYFLSLGRFVAKKNLQTLLIGYKRYLVSSDSPATHLVLVGSGPEQNQLLSLCHQLGLPIYSKCHAGKTDRSSNPNPPDQAPGVHFYGFRQIEENPIFYALADAFVLPSVREEWGLVVNEAMASGLPVVVSRTAGCAEDLLEILPLHGVDPQGCLWIEDPTLRSCVRQNGFAFDPDQPAQLGHILVTLEKDVKLREAMGRESRRIIGRFSCENFGRNALLAADAALRRRSVVLHRLIMIIRQANPFAS